MAPTATTKVPSFTAVMAPTLEHPQLGSVAGIHHKDAIQYLGIPYATLAHRFAAPTVKSEYSDGIDATKYG